MDMAGTIGNFYTGLIYEFKILSTVVADASPYITSGADLECPPGHCTNCPSFTACADFGEEKCLINCNYN